MSNSADGLLKNIARVLSANFVVAFVGLVGSFIFPRILSIEAYAIYHTFTLYTGYITALHFGFASGMTIRYAGKNYNKINTAQYKSEIMLLLCIWGLFTLIFVVVSIPLKSEMLLYVALSIIPIGLVGSYKSFLQAWTRFRTFSVISSLLAVIVPVTAIIYYLITHDLPGNIYIIIFLVINWIATVYVFFEILIKGVKSAKIFSKYNLETEKIGFAILIGNYINILLTSADKQFVKWFFSTNEFAFYSFAMSMQSIMTVFITSIAQPLFPAMAQGKFKDEDYSQIKDLLFIFGSLSGCAYFVLSIVVNQFIVKYIPSLEVIGIYFVVFPVMAVINCLYINLYKIKEMMKTYVVTLAGVLLIAVLLNTAFTYWFGKYTGVAIATTITYFIWFFIGVVQFKFIKISAKDIIYLVIYIVIFFSVTRFENDYLGFIIYLASIVTLDSVCYGKILMQYSSKLLRRKF